MHLLPRVDPKWEELPPREPPPQEVVEELERLRPEKDADDQCSPQHWPQEELQREKCCEQLESPLMTRQ